MELNLACIKKEAKEIGSVDKQELLTTIHDIKNTLVLKNFKSLNLKEIWLAFFNLIANTGDEQIKMEIRSVFGIILYFIAPFYPNAVLNSFLSTVRLIKPHKSLSICILGCFCQITHAVSIIHLHDFFSSFPLLEHLGEEIRDDLKYLPTLFSIMKPINQEVNFVIFKTLIKNFGNNEKDRSIVVRSLYELIKISPAILENDDEHLKNEKIAISLYPSILHDKELTKHVKKENLDVVLNIAKKIILLGKEASFTEYEQSCNIIALLQANGHKEAMRYELPDEIQQDRKIFIYKLSNNLDFILPSENDSRSVLNAKITALSFFLQRTENVESIIRVLHVLLNFIDSNDDSLIHSIKCITIIFQTVPSASNLPEEIVELLDEALERILNKKAKNWMPKLYICQLLENVKGRFATPEFKSKRLSILLDYSLSSHNKVAEEALSVLVKTVTIQECNSIMSFVISSDLFDNHTLCCCLTIINKVAKVFRYSLFQPLSGVLIEAFFMSTSMSVAREFLEYINNIEIEQNDMIIIKVHKLFCRLYKGFTGIDISPVPADYPLLTTEIDTNVLTESFESQKNYNKVFKESIKFLLKWGFIHQMNFSTFSHCAMFVPEFSMKYLSFFKDQHKGAVTRLLFDLANYTTSVSVAAKAAKVAHEIGVKNPKFESTVYHYLATTKFSGSDLYYFSLFIGEDKALRYVSYINSPSSLLYYTLAFPDENFILKSGHELCPMFSQWAIDNPYFEKALIANKGKVTFDESQIDYENLDNIHLRFMGEHPEFFPGIKIPERFSYERKYSKIVVEDPPTFVSLVPSIYQDEICDNEALLKNFCVFSPISIRDQDFSRIAKVLARKGLFEDMFHLSILQRATIPESVFEGADLTGDQLIAAGKAYYKNPKKSASVESLFLAFEKNYPNPIVMMKHDKRAFALVAFNPQKAMESFANNFDCSIKQIKALIFFTSNFSHFPDLDRKVIFKFHKENKYEDVDKYEYTWFLRLIRNYTNFVNNVSPEIVEIIIKATSSAHISEVAGIITASPCVLYLSNVHSNYLKVVYTEGFALLGQIMVENINDLLLSAIPSRILIVIRSIPSIAHYLPKEQQANLLRIIFQIVRETRNFIVLKEFKERLVFLKGTDSLPNGVGHLAAIETINLNQTFTLSSEKEMFKALIEGRRQMKTDEEIKTEIIDYFIKDNRRPSFDFAPVAIDLMNPLGAACFAAGQAGNVRVNFLYYYTYLSKIFTKLNPNEKKEFIEITRSTILPNIECRERAEALSMLLEDKRESVFKGANIAALYNSL